MVRRRVGVVLPVPAGVAAEVDGLRRAVGDGALGRIPAHLTLVPPVNVREDDMGEALAVLRRAAASSGSITVTLGPPATFLPVNPVLYLPVQPGPGLEAVHRLRDAVFTPPLERSLSWSFVPHVTLADEAEPARIEAGMAALRDFEVEVTFDSVALLEEGDGRIWQPIADVAFGASAVIGRGGLEVEITRSAVLDAEAEQWNKAEWDQYSLASYGVEREDEEPFALTARRPHDGRLLGTATGSTTGPDGYLANLIVDATERNAGVGAHLLAATEALAAERGCTRLTLRTIADGPARRFYERHGWRAYATLPRWRRDRDFVQMERLL
jgi:2'-5' RNA ligase/GNAT superfamily N-acetyltransferase